MSDGKLITLADAKLVTLGEYLNLITSEHNQQPRYMATVALSIAPYIESLNQACKLIGLFDLDRATGQALDFVGQWIGLSRFLRVTADLWFSFDTLGLGFDEGRWKVPWEEEFNVIRLDDEDYRNFLRAKVLGNYWDGTIPGAYRAWDQLFGASGYTLAIQDQQGRPESYVHGNMHVWQILFGPPMSQVTRLMFQGGYLGLKSAGVGTGYMVQSQPDTGFDGTPLPLFAFDSEQVILGNPQTTWDAGQPGGPSIWDREDSQWDRTASITTPNPGYPAALYAGFDQGAWGQILPPLPGQEPRPQSLWDTGIGPSFWDGDNSLWDVAKPMLS